MGGFMTLFGKVTKVLQKEGMAGEGICPVCGKMANRIVLASRSY
jgi:hypothetical protein